MPDTRTKDAVLLARILAQQLITVCTDPAKSTLFWGVRDSVLGTPDALMYLNQCLAEVDSGHLDAARAEQWTKWMLRISAA